MSINSGIMSNDRELCSSAHLLKGTSNLGLSEVDMDAVDRQMQFDTVGKFEPDWRRFEAVFARGGFSHLQPLLGGMGLLWF
jgi:hypothetical protein